MSKSRLITIAQAACAAGLLVLFVLPIPVGPLERVVAVLLLAALVLPIFARSRVDTAERSSEGPGGLRKMFDESGVVGRSILDGVPDPAIVVDNKFGISVVNKAAHKALEINEGSGIPCFTAIHGLDAPCDESGQPCVIKTGQSWKTIQTRRGDDGEEQLVELRATPLFDDAGEVMGAVEVLHDLNEQEKLALSLQRAKEDAASADKARTDFVATVSHEVRTPMNAVLGMADLLRLTALTRKQKSYVQVMESSSNMLLSLVDNMIGPRDHGVPRVFQRAGACRDSG
jgi:PAS domain S-box-containing protein